MSRFPNARGLLLSWLVALFLAWSSPGTAQARTIVVQGNAKGVELRISRRHHLAEYAIARPRALFTERTPHGSRATSNGGFTGSTTYILIDGLSRIVETPGRVWHDHTATRNGDRLIYASAALGNYNELLAALQAASIREMLQRGPTSIIPARPLTPITYVTRAGGTAVHHGDTVRATSRCPAWRCRTRSCGCSSAATRCAGSPRRRVHMMVGGECVAGRARGQRALRALSRSELFKSIPKPTKGICNHPEHRK